MELDELKNYLRNSDSQITTSVVVQKDLSTILKGNPKSPIRKIKNSLVFELLLTIGLIILFIYGVVVIKIWSIKLYLMLVLMVCILFIVPLFKFYRRIISLSVEVLSIKANLQEVYDLMKKFVRMYFQITMGLIPVFFTIAFTLGYLEGKKHTISEFDVFFMQLHHAWMIWMIVLFYVIGTCFGIYYFTRWYLNKLYGRYIDELKVMLDELQNC